MDHYDVTVTALNVMDGLNLRDHWDTLQPAWEEEGMGFVEFCVWLTDASIMANEQLETRLVQDFPGVFDYEVSHTIGELIVQHVTSTGKLPTQKELAHWWATEMDSFFATGAAIAALESPEGS